MRPPALLFGVPIDDVTMEETVDVIAAMVADGRASGRTHQVATVNVDFLVHATADPFVRGVLQRAALNIPDGMPVLWGAKLAGTPLRERVTGVDLVDALVARAETTGWRIHFFGSAPDVADRALALLRERHPGAAVSAESGPMLADVERVDDAVLDAIAAIDADILCVALGNPKQERFIAAHATRLGVPVSIGVGGTLDMLVGDRRRAPRWMQRVGLEWVFRAAQEPKRLGRRYAHDAVVFGPKVLRYARQVRRLRTEGAGPAGADGALALGAVRRLSLPDLARAVGRRRDAARRGEPVGPVALHPDLVRELRALDAEGLLPSDTAPDLGGRDGSGSVTP